MLYLQRYFKQALHISDPADKALTIHPIGTSVKSDECNKPANFVPHYNQRGQFFTASISCEKSTSIYGFKLKIIRYLDMFAS